MDNTSVGSGFLRGPSVGFIDLESPVQRRQQSPLGQSMTQHQMPSTMNMLGGNDDDRSISFMDGKGLNPKSFSMSFGRGKGACGSAVNHQNVSEEDEPNFEDGNGENSSGVKGKKGSPWQRMKWTDTIVRLLIQVVACVGDDGTVDGFKGTKRSSGMLQKKGKWKTVSKIMISKGCYVSPQQCEDKFNDLNKRYKRLNDILGRGTSCRVVENPSLMDSMPQLSNKMKEDVKKILSSKHLFYQEMCAYHNGQPIPNCGELDLQIHSATIVQCTKENNVSEAEAEEDSESEDNDSDSEDENPADRDFETYGRTNAHEDGFQAEVARFFEDPTKSKLEKTVWLKKKMLELQDQRVSIQVECFELEKRRFKWERFCEKKNMELEISKLDNERMLLENERMAMQLKHKELEMDSENQGPSVNQILNPNRQQVKNQIDLGRHI